MILLMKKTLYSSGFLWMIIFQSKTVSGFPSVCIWTWTCGDPAARHVWCTKYRSGAVSRVHLWFIDGLYSCTVSTDWRPSILLRLQHYVQCPPPPSPSPHLQPVSDFTSLQARETPSVSGHLSRHRQNYYFRTLLLLVLILHQRETGINNPWPWFVN